MAEDADDLISELLADSKPPTHGCTVCAWLEGRDDAEKWDRAFTNEKITQAALLRGMRKRGYPYKVKAIANHKAEKHRVG